ncbi:MAG: DUF2252 domain-containing protein, partial [Candidatus Eremiobacteraeota bacterium]|nr:DUF2252 domain-containing protein [Candidatus Eremiobacteraeota bacterium]
TGFDAGKAARKRIPRSDQASATLAPGRDPLRIIADQDRQRIPHLIPLRHERMARSTFSFFRGTAAVMAADLAATPTTGAIVQACGDCHLANFGLFGTAERNVIFDLHDFDESLPAPWEWDVKRLATSAVLVGRDLGGSEREARTAALSVAEAYRSEMRTSAQSSALDVWFSRVDPQVFLSTLDAAQARSIERKQRDMTQRGEHVPPKFVAKTGGKLSFMEDPPVLYHLPHNDPLRKRGFEGLRRYAKTLRDDTRVVFSRYHLRDAAIRVVGVGSVGLHSAIALFQAGADDVLILQLKEATASVLEPYAGASVYANHGQRVVAGQRLMQSSSDIFLGWSEIETGQHYYVRRFRDRRANANLERLGLEELIQYSALCGATLAIGHARSGDAAFLSGYMGRGRKFDEAIADFAVAYADHAQRDYETFIASEQMERAG